MAEPKINFSDYNASGVYTIEVDGSVNEVLQLVTGRLVVGSSRVGPYNTIVLLKDLRQRNAVYGEVDPKLEKAGSYFHRSLEIALREGPVYALNIAPLDTEEDKNANLDTAAYATFNTESGANNDIGVEKFYPTIEFFNKRQLWYADTDSLNRVKNLDLGDDPTDPNFGQNTPESNKILSFANLGSSNCTIWVRRADVRGFDLTAKEWFSSLGTTDTDLPSFVHPDDMISDYFVEVIVVNGDWTNYLKLSKDPIYKQFFNEEGLIMSRANNFFALREIKVISRTTGCLIPDFKDQRGSTVSIDKLMNREFPTTNVLCALDVEKLDMIDLTNDTFTETDVETHRVDLVGHGFDDLNAGDAYSADDGGYLNDGTTPADPTPLIDVLSYKKPADSTLVFEITNDFGQVGGEISDTNFLAGFSDNGPTNPVAIGDTYVITPSVGDTYVVAMQGSKLYEAYTNGFLKTGDVVTDGTATDYYIRVNDNFTVLPDGGSTELSYIKVLFFEDSSLLNQASITTSDVAYGGPTPGVYFIQVEIENGSVFKKVFDLTTDFLSYSVQQPNKITLEFNTADQAEIDEFIKINQFIKAKTTAGRTRLLKIISVSRPTVNLSSPSTVTYTVTVMTPSQDEVVGLDTTGETLTVYKGIYNFVTSLKGQYVRGFKLRDEILPNGTSDRQDEILSYLFDYTKIPQALANGELIDFRYVVDTYEGQISANSKYYLMKLAATRQKCLAIVNDPSMKQFEKSVDPSFIDTTTKLLSVEHISTGGNLTLNPEFTFKFGEEDINGIPLSSFGYFAMPWYVVQSGTKNIIVPPAAAVSNTFVRKFRNGTMFEITAGSKRGLISEPDLIGLEYELTDEDRAYLEPVGHNLIVRRKGAGTMILSNNTAYQRVNSALNSAHVRDILSTIERDIEKMLFTYLFDYNDEVVRLRVKTMLENYLDRVVNARGLVAYEVEISENNNTAEVIAARSAIVDIRVNFPRGIHKFFNRITLTRTDGSLSTNSSGFIPSF